MSILNSILGQVSDTATVQNLAAKVGLSPEQVEQAVAALGQAHGQEGDTVTTAAEQTGVPQDKLQEIVSHIGGEGALGRFASLLQEDGAAGGMLGQIKSMF
jgi:ATP phosphoribosyltransferase regulatory subunit HisZ